jgi:hypothetical protein
MNKNHLEMIKMVHSGALSDFVTGGILVSLPAKLFMPQAFRTNPRATGSVQLTDC